jgi:hypothetical protein
MHSTDEAIDKAIDEKTPVDILLQPIEPTYTSKVGFWLPTPSCSPSDLALCDFSLVLRMYWPSKTALQEKWVPPPVQIQ